MRRPSNRTCIAATLAALVVSSCSQGAEAPIEAPTPSRPAADDALAVAASVSAPEPGTEVVVEPAAPVKSVAPSEPGASAFRFASRRPSDCSLATGRDDFILLRDDRAFAPTVRGFVARPDVDRLLALRADGEDLRLLAGAEPVARFTRGKSARHVRASGKASPRVDGWVEHTVAVGTAQAWSARSSDGVSSVLYLDGGVRALPLPSNAGPELAGLSPTAQARCTKPEPLALFADGHDLVAVLGECHVAAPVHLARWSPPSFALRDELLVPEPRLEHAAFAVRAGQVVLAGRFRGHPTIARRTADGWASASSELRAVLVDQMVLGADGSAFVIALGQDADRHDDWQLLHEDGGRLARIAITDEGGTPLRFPTLAYHPATGVVVCASGEGGRWLLVEKSGFAD